MLPTEPEPQPEIRISDADRNEVVELLRQHCSEGRLTLDEFSDRVGDVFAARTRSDLDKATADLPVPVRAEPAPSSPAYEPETRRRAVRHWIVGVMSGGAAKGRWRPAEETNVLAIMGGCEVDLRKAEIDGPEVVIRAWAVMGGIEIIVPEGIEVELNGFAFMGGNEKRIADVPRLPGSPVVRVQAFSFMGGVSVKSRRPGQRSRHQAVSSGGASGGPQPGDPGYRGYERGERIRERYEERHNHVADRIAEHQRKLERALERAAEEMNRTLPRLPPIFESPQSPQSPQSPPSQSASRGPRDASAPAGTVTILFSDIEGFSSMTERLGDRQAQDIVRVHNAIVRGNVGACGGFEVKSQGDGFMIAFDSASKALRCATAIQHELSAYSRTHPEEPIKVRMGLHTGEAIKDENDFLGRTVIVASRIADEACGGEVLVSALLKELVTGTGEFRFGEPREATLKGLNGTHMLVPVLWSA